MNMNKLSWKTTTAGILSLLITIFAMAQKYLYGQPIEAGDITALIAGMTVAIGLIQSRDNDRTSEEVGADVWARERKTEEMNR